MSRCFPARLVPSQEFRANPDATWTLNGETRTALEVALRSSDRRAVAGIAELLKRGARLMNRPVRDWLPPWTAQDIQAAEPKDPWAAASCEVSVTALQVTRSMAMVDPSSIMSVRIHLEHQILKELVRHFLATWPPFCRDLMNIDHSLRLKELLAN